MLLRLCKSGMDVMRGLSPFVPLLEFSELRVSETVEQMRGNLSQES